MDGDLIHKEFQKTKGKIQSYYTNKDGVKKEFMHINSKYDLSTDINKTGIAIDFYNSSFQEEGSSRVEYLISEKFVVEEFKEKCNLELVEAVNFQNIYHTFKSFFTETAKYEENPKTR
jgi:hypothetical protein